MSIFNFEYFLRKTRPYYFYHICSCYQPIGAVPLRFLYHGYSSETNMIENVGGSKGRVMGDNSVI